MLINKLKSLRWVAIWQLIFAIVQIIIFIVLISIVASKYNGKYTQSSLETLTISLSPLSILSSLFALVNFVLWIVGMVMAFGINERTTHDYYSSANGDYTGLKIFSVLNGLTLNIGLLVAISIAIKNAKTSSVLIPTSSSSTHRINEVSLEQKLDKLENLLNEEYITEEEYKILRNKILINDIKQDKGGKNV